MPLSRKRCKTAFPKVPVPPVIRTMLSLNMINPLFSLFISPLSVEAKDQFYGGGYQKLLTPAGLQPEATPPVSWMAGNRNTEGKVKTLNYPASFSPNCKKPSYHHFNALFKKVVDPAIFMLRVFTVAYAPQYSPTTIPDKQRGPRPHFCGHQNLPKPSLRHYVPCLAVFGDSHTEI